MEVEDRESTRHIRSLEKLTVVTSLGHLGVRHSEKELVQRPPRQLVQYRMYRCQFNYLRTFGITIQLDVDYWHHCSHSI